MRMSLLAILIILGLSAIIIYQNYPTLSKYLPSNILPSTGLPSTSLSPTSIPSGVTPSIINLTGDATTVTLYPNIPQQFSYRAYTGAGGVGGVPREIKTYYCTITFDPNTPIFSLAPPEQRIYYLKVSEVIEQYYTKVTPLSGYYTTPNAFPFMVGQSQGVIMNVKSVSRDGIVIAMKGLGIGRHAINSSARIIHTAPYNIINNYVKNKPTIRQYNTINILAEEPGGVFLVACFILCFV